MNTSRLKIDKDYSLEVYRSLREDMTNVEKFTFHTAHRVFNKIIVLVFYIHDDYKTLAVGLHDECIRRAELSDFPYNKENYEIQVLLGRDQ
jgi:hypothetical protein